MIRRDNPVVTPNPTGRRSVEEASDVGRLLDLNALHDNISLLRRFRSVLFLAFCGLTLAAVATVTAGAQSGSFTRTGDMTIARSQHTATLLPNGKVLIAGGVQSSSNGTRVLASTELYDPTSGRFTPAANMTATRRLHTATLLPDGRVLIAGGYGGDNSGGETPLGSAELYDPSSDRFTRTGDLITATGFQSALVLPSGRVLIVGGSGAGTYPNNIAPAELYDPNLGTFMATGPYVGRGECDFCAPSVLLADGTILFPGQNPAQLYNPGTNAFTLTGMMIDDQSAATLLLNGKVLLAGGASDFGRSATAELYDPLTGAFSATGSMTARRVWHALTLLPTGLVLTTGGETDSCGGMTCSFAGTIRSAELYDPSAGTFHATGDMTTPREGHTATVLADGRVLVAGGDVYRGIGLFDGSVSTAEVYRPDVLVPAISLLWLSGGDGQGAIYHAGTSYVTRSEDPAAAGDEVDILCRGLSAGARIAPQVAIGGRLAEIVSVGDAPGVAGAKAVRVRVPREVIAGSAVTVRLTYLGRPSNVVTMAIK